VVLDGDGDLDLDTLALTAALVSAQLAAAEARGSGHVELPTPRGLSTRHRLRAAESVARNIAEGAGRWSGADRPKHYKIARGEAVECAASLDVMRVRRVITSQRYDDGIRLLESVVAMLTKMV